ncbi:unnamed protein product, partial [Prunus brigantina]
MHKLPFPTTHVRVSIPFRRKYIVIICGSTLSSMSSSTTAPLVISVPTLVSSASHSSLSQENSMPRDIGPIDSMPHDIGTTTSNALDNYSTIASSSDDNSSASSVSSNSQSTNVHPMQTRAKSGISQQKTFSDYHCYHTSLPVIHEENEPFSYKVASQSPVWLQAMQEEIDALQMQGTWQLDVKNAFLHGELEEEVFMRQPQGFEDPKHPADFVCKLNKSLYGLKQAPRAWNAKFTGYLPAIGFKSSHSDPSLFLVQTVIDDLGEVFEMKDMGRLTYFLGLQVSYNSTGDIFVHQHKYAKDLLQKAEPLHDPTFYRSIVGALQYLTFTRPDLSYAVNTVCQYMTAPTEIHFNLVKRILRYIQGFVVLLGHNPISWQSKKQGSVSRSSTEAEYRALANTAADLAWIRQVLLDLKVCLPQPPTIFCDNLSALALSSNPVYHSRIKHLDTDFHFVRERVQRNDLIVQYVPTQEQVADVFTKGLHSPIFLSHCISMRLGNP